MRLLPLLLTGVSVVGLVTAEPIRVAENPSNAKANIRFGHALANANVNANDDDVARIVRPPTFQNTPEPYEKSFSRHFCGASLREKAIRISNAFRHALGMPPIDVNAALPRPGEVHILPLPFVPDPHDVLLHPDGEMVEVGKPVKHIVAVHLGPDYPEHPHHHGHHGPHGHHHKHKSFLRRIHRAIMALGPWEGRAVAFVLGCGIGVLLRMFWVLSVLAYRTVRGDRGEEILEREYIVYEQLPETLFVAPPEYVDEKANVEAHEEVEECK